MWYGWPLNTFDSKCDCITDSGRWRNSCEVATLSARKKWSLFVVRPLNGFGHYATFIVSQSVRDNRRVISSHKPFWDQTVCAHRATELNCETAVWRTCGRQKETMLGTFLNNNCSLSSRGWFGFTGGSNISGGFFPWMYIQELCLLSCSASVFLVTTILTSITSHQFFLELWPQNK